MKGTVATKTKYFVSHGVYAEYFIIFLSFIRILSKQSMQF